MSLSTNEISSSSNNEEANEILRSFIGESEIENLDNSDIMGYSNSILMSNENYKKINIIEDKIVEEILFIHYFQKVRILEIPNKSSIKQSSSFYDYEDDINDYSELCNTEVLEKIREEQILIILKSKIEKYLSYKDTQFNCIFMRNLYSYAEEIGYENTLGFLLPLVQELRYNTDINESIYAAFFDGLEKLLNFLLNFDKKKTVLFTKIIPLIKYVLYTKKDIFLLNKAIAQLKIIMLKITREEFYQNILPMLIEMANNEKNQFGQETAIEIFNDTAYLLGNEIIEFCILPHFQAFSLDDNEDIRRCCISNMIHLCENINFSALENKFIIIYSRFAYDSSKTNRMICCDLIPSLCKISKSDIVYNKILSVYLILMNDSDIFVKSHCLSIFGEFISYIKVELIEKNPELLNFYYNHFLFLYENNKNKNDLQPIIKCAFSFPSVLNVYYKKMNSIENWNKLKIIYEKLINDNNIKIKKAIANSFAEVSKILGYKISENELNPIIINMFNNNDNKIKECIIGIIPDYINSINDFDIKLEYLNIIKNCFNEAKNSKKWRNKIYLIKFTGKIIGAFNNDILFIEILYFCIQMCFDKFNIVRIKAAKTLSKLLLYFLTVKIQSSDDSSYKENCIKILKNFATSFHYHYRQLFIFMCKKLIFNEDILNNVIMNFLEDLSFDKITNVKITLGNIVYKSWDKVGKNEKYSFFRKNNKILEIMYRLKNDNDFDVRKTMENIDSKLLVKEIENFDLERILSKNNANEGFNNKFEDIKNIFGFTPDVIRTNSIKIKNWQK